MSSDITQDYSEFLIRVEVSQGGDHSKELPDVPFWSKSRSVVDNETKVRYATYSKLAHQGVTGEGPDIDALAAETVALETFMEQNVQWNLNRLCYEKRIHLVSHPLAVWITEQGD